MIKFWTKSHSFDIFGAQSQNISIFDVSENQFLDVFIHIYGSKVYPEESSYNVLIKKLEVTH